MSYDKAMLIGDYFFQIISAESVKRAKIVY